MVRATRRELEDWVPSTPMIYFDHLVGFDPNGIGRVYASTWIEARQEARKYIRKRPDTAPLSAWRFELLDQKLRFSSPLHLDRQYGAPSMPRWR